MALMMRHPTRDDWASVRPTVERFRKEQHTTAWIARQLGILYGYRVTKKMVYDPLREWNAPPKYQRQKSHHRIIRAIRTSSEDFQMHATLSSVGVFLDSFAEQAAWQSPEMYRDLDFQRLIAEALMAISSTSYDAKAVWHELRGMEQRVQSVISSFNVTVHPRVLSVLLRLLVQNRQTGQIERKAVKLAKQMICKKSVDSLQPTHPVASLAALDLPREKTEVLLEKFTTQLDSRLYDKVREDAPDIVALEKIYTARALASFGFPGTADTVLESASSLKMQYDFTRAELHRTIGFSQFQKYTSGTIDAALENLQLALDLFESVGKGSSVEAMYVDYNLGSVYEKMHGYEECVQHFEAALEIWELNTPAYQQHGGIKYVRDLHEAYKRLDWTTNMRCLRDRYAAYFEES